MLEKIVWFGLLRDMRRVVKTTLLGKIFMDWIQILIGAFGRTTGMFLVLFKAFKLGWLTVNEEI